MLMGSEWSDSISYQSLGTLYKRKFNKPDLLPVTEDLIGGVEKASPSKDCHLYRDLKSCTNNTELE